MQEYLHKIRTTSDLQHDVLYIYTEKVVFVGLTQARPNYTNVGQAWVSACAVFFFY